MASAAAPGQDKIDPKVLKTALILIVGFMGVIFDTTIVSFAKPTSASSSQAAWSSAASSSSPRRRCRCNCSVTPTRIAQSENKRCLHSLLSDRILR